MAGKPDHARNYGTAHLLATDEEREPMFVEVAFCRKCGSLVYDMAKHDEFHAQAGVRAHFGGALMQPRVDTLLNIARVILEALDDTPVARVSVDVDEATITIKVAE